MTLILYSGNSHTASQGFEKGPDLVCAEFCQIAMSEKGDLSACKDFAYRKHSLAVSVCRPYRQLFPFYGRC
jgi:hypothetical protein